MSKAFSERVTARTPSENAGGGASRPKSLRIFLVENHPDTLKYLRMYLEQMGHVVFGSNNFTDALERLPKSHCDVLISDIGLPDGTGWDLLQRTHLPQPVYAIAMSGLGMNADRARSLAAGYRQHLLKPFPPEELEQFLDEALRERRPSSS